MPKYNLLIVDDDTETVQMLTEFLSEKEYDVDSALSGEEALKIADAILRAICRGVARNKNCHIN